MKRLVVATLLRQHQISTRVPNGGLSTPRSSWSTFIPRTRFITLNDHHESTTNRPRIDHESHSLAQLRCFTRAVQPTVGPLQQGIDKVLTAVLAIRICCMLPGSVGVGLTWGYVYGVCIYIYVYVYIVCVGGSIQCVQSYTEDVMKLL